MNDSQRTYNPAVFRGVGKPETVLDAYIDALGDETEIGQDLLALKVLVSAMLNDPDAKRIITSLACSVMNLNYLDHGHCYQSDESGDTGFAYSEPGETRNMIYHGLINLPGPA